MRLPKAWAQHAAVELSFERRIAELLQELDRLLPISRRKTASCRILVQIARPLVGLQHARERGELADHAADIADLTDDRFGALIEDAAQIILVDLLRRSDAGCVRPTAGWGVSGS